MFTAKQHFAWAFDRLVEIDSKPSMPALIEASAILRRLLLDQKPLLAQANTPRLAKIRFPLLDIAANLERSPLINPGTLMLGSMQGFAPELRTNWDYVVLLPLDKFLAVKKTLAMGKFLSVRDIIDHVANNAGGVHYSDPINEAQSAVRDSYNGFIVGGIPALLSDLQAIVKAVLQGLAILYHRITLES